MLLKHPHFHLDKYSDSDNKGSPGNRHSTGGYAIYFGTNLVSWSSCKQFTVALIHNKGLVDAATEITGIEILIFKLVTITIRQEVILFILELIRYLGHLASNVR